MFCEYTMTGHSRSSRASRDSTSPLLALVSGALPRSQSMIASTGLLEQLGYRVRWAADASAALAELERDGIDIVFSDVVMPGKMDGIGLAKTIREKNPKIQILLVTGYSSSTKEIGSQFPILRKPYQLHELSRELQKLAS